jgi:ribosomal protein S18 acetylase RimI-like enzyme
MTGPAIRRAVPADAEALARLHIDAWRAAYRGLVPDRILDGFSLERRTAWWRTRLTEGGDGPEHTWVAEDAGGIAGFVTSGPARDESAPPPPGAGEIQAIYMRPDVIGRGVGRALLERAVDDLRAAGFDPLVVWVFEANDRARHVYEAAGFTPDGTRAPVDFGDSAVVPEVRYVRSLGRRIRPATVDDADRLAEVQVASYLDTYVGIMPDSVIARVQPGRYAPRWREQLGDPTRADEDWVWVGEVDGIVQGYVLTQPASDQFRPPPPGAGEVESLYLHPAAIGRGLGRALLEHGVRDLRARGFEPLVLWAFDANARARRFYERAGWQLDVTGEHWVLDDVPVPIVRYRLSAG